MRARGIMEHLDYDSFAIYCCNTCNLWYSEPGQWGSRKQAGPLKDRTAHLYFFTILSCKEDDMTRHQY
jgi:hypothetical protein